MKKQAFIELMQHKLEGRDDLAEVIVAEMDFCQTAILESNAWLPWFLESEVSVAATTVGDSRVQLPSDFLLEVEEAVLHLELENGVIAPLRKMDYDVAFQRYGRGKGMPKMYALVGDYFYVFPTPDESFRISMLYYARDRLPSETDLNTENRWLKHASGLFLAVVGRELAAKVVQNDGLTAAFTADIMPEWQKLYNRHTAIKENNRERG